MTELAYVDVTDELWKQDPAAVNKEIIRRIEEREPPPRPVAPPSAATDLRVTLTPEQRRFGSRDRGR
jgi:hypothetical protein